MTRCGPRLAYGRWLLAGSTEDGSGSERRFAAKSRPQNRRLDYLIADVPDHRPQRLRLPKPLRCRARSYFRPDSLLIAAIFSGDVDGVISIR